MRIAPTKIGIYFTGGKIMPPYRVYGSHTTEACPVNKRDIAQKLVQFSEADLKPLPVNTKLIK